MLLKSNVLIHKYSNINENENGLLKGPAVARFGKIVFLWKESEFLGCKDTQ